MMIAFQLNVYIGHIANSIYYEFLEVIFFIESRVQLKCLFDSGFI